MKKAIILSVFLVINLQGFSQKKDYLFTIKTSKGIAHALLFDDTPLHKANFIKLVNNKFYDSLLFHRVIEGFMIQGGDPTSKNAKENMALGSGGGDMARIPFEFKPNHIHTKGVIAAARDNNPEKASSACQFYIVQGKKLSDDEITNIAKRNKMSYTTDQRVDLLTKGGTPFLDNNYTVFGTLIDNFDLIDRIAAVEKSQGDRPKTDVKMSISVKKIRKKKITKKYGYKFN